MLNFRALENCWLKSESIKPKKIAVLKVNPKEDRHLIIRNQTFFRLFQVLVLRELAVSAPTFFFQQVQPFFDNIFYAVWDPKQAIREGAVSALRACLILTTQRETKEMQKPQWYKVRAAQQV